MRIKLLKIEFLKYLHSPWIKEQNSWKQTSWNTSSKYMTKKNEVKVDKRFFFFKIKSDI